MSYEHMSHAHEKNFLPNSLYFSNKLFFVAGNTYNKSAGIWRIDSKIKIWIQNFTTCQILNWKISPRQILNQIF